MRKKLWIIVLLAGLHACSQKHEYRVGLVGDGTIGLDGVKDERAWSDAKEIKSFSNPWNKEISPETSLSMLRDGEYLYFFFDVGDEEIVTAPDFSQERDVEREDRVEIFLSKDKDMREYYCFEIDAMGRTLSYAASHYRQFNFDWEAPAGYKVAARTYPGGYSVEGAIPLVFLEELKNGKELFFGAYRAEFSLENNKLEENWLTWADPATASPDFHVPASLGRLRLNR
jgi:chondroitin AC lyase